MTYYGLKMREKDGLVWGVFEGLEELGFLKHWITTRKGGVSKGNYAQLNLGGHVGDDPSAVAKNRKKTADLFFDGGRIFLPNQVHGTRHIIVDGKNRKRNGDVLIMAKAGYACGVLTADCLPVIIADPVKKTAALAHAGRRGIYSHILSGAVRALKDGYGSDPRDMVAAIGPGIRRCCYEVGEEIFEEEGHDYFMRFWTQDGKLDLIYAATFQLLESGVSSDNILDSEICTSCQDNVFYSHRGQKGKAGRFMTGTTIL